MNHTGNILKVKTNPTKAETFLSLEQNAFHLWDLIKGVPIATEKVFLSFFYLFILFSKMYHLNSRGTVGPSFKFFCD